MSAKVVSRVIAVVLLVTVFAQAPVASAMEIQGKPPEQAPVTVNVKLAVEKLEKDRVTSQIPFDLIVRSGRETTLNHGRQVAVPQQVGKDGTIHYMFHSIGSNIQISDLQATERFITFSLMIDISAVDPTPNPAVPISQSFRKYTLQTSVVVKPGEPTIVTVSTDQIGAEVVRLTVFATFVK